MTTNIALTFSQSTNGKPIIISSTTTPGTLIHKANNSLDFVWLYISLDQPISYLDEVYLTLVKGDSITGYVTDGAAYRLSSTSKQPIELGIPVSNQCEVRAFINPISTLENVNVSVSGYVNRRID